VSWASTTGPSSSSTPGVIQKTAPSPTLRSPPSFQVSQSMPMDARSSASPPVAPTCVRP
jgi:hypothetical protein